jgi:hypothetical protein
MDFPEFPFNSKDLEFLPLDDEALEFAKQTMTRLSEIEAELRARKKANKKVTSVQSLNNLVMDKSFWKVPRQVKKLRRLAGKLAVDLMDHFFDRLDAWQKEYGLFSVSQLAKEFNTSRTRIKIALRELVSYKVILVLDRDNYGKVIFFNTESNQVLLENIREGKIILEINRTPWIQLNYTDENCTQVVGTKCTQVMDTNCTQGEGTDRTQEMSSKRTHPNDAETHDIPASPGTPKNNIYKNNIYKDQHHSDQENKYELSADDKNRNLISIEENIRAKEFFVKDQTTAYGQQTGNSDYVGEKKEVPAGPDAALGPPEEEINKIKALKSELKKYQLSLNKSGQLIKKYGREKVELCLKTCLEERKKYEIRNVAGWIIRVIADPDFDGTEILDIEKEKEELEKSRRDLIEKNRKYLELFMFGNTGIRHISNWPEQLNQFAMSWLSRHGHYSQDIEDRVRYVLYEKFANLPDELRKKEFIKLGIYNKSEEDAYDIIYEKEINKNDNYQGLLYELSQKVKSEELKTLLSEAVSFNPKLGDDVLIDSIISQFNKFGEK